ncbi:MAG: hypothetical protein O7D91_09095 [Planctomycetota bacterium]|nr:hypothetical protein [Planctomycetota bacterium]
MTEPQQLKAVEPRPPSAAAAMAVAVQANLVQLNVACGKRAALAGVTEGIHVPPPGGVTQFRETLIPRDIIGSYDDTALLIRTREVWGQFCLLCWYFYATDPQNPLDFKNLPTGQCVHCPTSLLNKTREIEKSLWRLRFEQRLRRDADFRNQPEFEDDWKAAQDIPAIVLGENVQVCSDESLLLGTCEFAGMLAAARWTGDSRWQWGQEGIMDLPGPASSP